MAEKTYFVLVGKRREGKPAEVPRGKVSKVIEDYPGKVLAQVTASQHQELLRQRYKVEDLGSKTKIRVGRLTIDPTIHKEREEAAGPAEEEAPEAEHYFVQFVGPVKAEWLELLNRARVVPLTYYHDFTYLVSGKATNVRRIARNHFVRAVIPYTAQVKLSDEVNTLAEDEEARSETREFSVLVFSDVYDGSQADQKLTRLGVEIVGKEESRKFYTLLRVRMPVSAVSEAAKLPAVHSIELYYPEVNEDEIANMIVATGQVPGAPPGGNHPYLDWLNDAGVDGTGVTIGIVEAGGGFDDNHPAFTGRVTNVTTEAAGTHGTMVAGLAAGDYQTETDGDGFIYGIGMAPNANLLNMYTGDGGDIQRCRDTVTSAGPNGENGTVQNNSWGAGTANPMDYRSKEANYDQAVRDADNNTPLVICFSAGNSGDNGLTRPKAAKNIIATGNFENSRTGLFGCGDSDADNINERYIRACADSVTGPSSIGNCADGRIKPDIVAPGQWTATANFGVTGVPGTDWWRRFVSNQIRYGGGTSAASPMTAGTCALLLQWWRQRHNIDASEQTPSPALVKAMLINGAVDTNEGGQIPNEEQGWGRINLNNVFNPELAVIYVDQDILLQETDADIEFDVEPIDTNQPMKITLVWTDVPGTVGSGTGADPAIPGDTGNPALQNILGLEITKGTDTWFGNNFAGGWSQTGGHQDAIQNACPGQIVNNVQNIFVQNPTGTYHVRISPEDINGNCVDPANPANLPLQQDFVLVIQNAKLKTTEPMDVMLCIDRTGSMTGEPIAAAKAAAMQFMDLIPTDNDNQAGLVSYATPCSYPYAPPCDADVSIADRATTDVDLAPVTDTLKNQMTDGAGPIANISAASCTSIGAGLKKSSERIVDNGSPLHRKTIILLTDGKENRSPCVADILPLLRKEYRVHVIAFGASINEAVVDQISSGTHAELLHAPTITQLAGFYHELLALEADEEVVGSETGTFADGEEEEAGVQVKMFPIVNSDSKATFIVGWKNPDVSLAVELVTPEGETITPAEAQGSGTISYVERDTHVIYTVQRPAPATDWEGEWSVRVQRASGSAMVAETYTASVLVSTSLRLKLIWDKVKYFTKDSVRLNVQAIDNQYVLKDGVKMVVRTTVPLQGYGTTLASVAKMAALPRVEDVIEGAFAALDQLSEQEWQALYSVSEQISEISFELVDEDVPEPSVSPIFATPHVAKLKRLFHPIKDGVYTYRIEVEGCTASGAGYTRLRTVSKYIGAKVDANQSTAVLTPVRKKEPKILRLTFIPKDLHGNLVGPGRSTVIKVDVRKGTLQGKLEDLLDGSYALEIEAAGSPQDTVVAVGMDDVSIPVVFRPAYFHLRKSPCILWRKLVRYLGR